jgi:hypothetical protein
MTLQNLLKKYKIQKIGKVPVIILPLKIWREIENQLEEAEMNVSVSLRKKIAKARSEKKLYSPSQVKKTLKF